MPLIDWFLANAEVIIGVSIGVVAAVWGFVNIRRMDRCRHYSIGEDGCCSNCGLKIVDDEHVVPKFGITQAGGDRYEVKVVFNLYKMSIHSDGFYKEIPHQIVSSVRETTVDKWEPDYINDMIVMERKRLCELSGVDADRLLFNKIEFCGR